MTTPRCTFPDLPGYVGRCVLPANHVGLHTGFSDIADLDPKDAEA